ncbi:hypothetical protein C8R42DRAFT_637098 [Lentinula raphanica]|nr:hypothetical protein C8R42DRAFT_637098 [Lentinula raphanica]
MFLENSLVLFTKVSQYQLVAKSLPQVAVTLLIFLTLLFKTPRLAKPCLSNWLQPFSLQLDSSIVVSTLVLSRLVFNLHIAPVLSKYGVALIACGNGLRWIDTLVTLLLILGWVLHKFKKNWYLGARQAHGDSELVTVPLTSNSDKSPPQLREVTGLALKAQQTLPGRPVGLRGVLSYLVYYNQSTLRSCTALREMTTFTAIMKSEETKNSYNEVLATSGTSKLRKKEIGPKIELDLIR